MKRVNTPHAVWHPTAETMVVPSPTETFEDDDVLVRAYPWLFDSVVEAASADPGEKRSLSLKK